MLNSDEDRTLDAVLERIVPTDGDTGGRVAKGYVEGRMALQPDVYRAGFALLIDRGFADLTPSEQEAVFTELETHPSLALIVQHTLEGFYTSEVGFAVVGFRVTA